MSAQNEPVPVCSDVVDRFWAKVDKSNRDGCWTWTASKKPVGYGEFWTADRLWYAHRYSYTLAFGDIPKGLYVCHRCNNKACVNPSHLYAATHGQNMVDAYKDGLIINSHAKKTRCTVCGSEYTHLICPVKKKPRRDCNPCRAKRARLRRARVRAALSRTEGV